MSETICELLDRIAEEKIIIEIDGEKKTVTKKYAMTHKLIEMALQGDLEAISLVMSFCCEPEVDILEIAKDIIAQA